MDPPDTLDLDLPENDDTPDDGDELGHMTTEQARASIDRDMANAEADAALLEPLLSQAPGRNGLTPPSPAATPAPPASGRPGQILLPGKHPQKPSRKPPSSTTRRSAPDG